MKLIVGALCICVLLLLVPTIPAMNSSTIKKTYQEKIERILEEYKLLLNTSWKFHPLALLLSNVVFILLLFSMGLKI
ncbi:MAG: hypothetical protein NT038_08440 [Euryarchaeota archaeon]|nr:hypothetical protein [Euryarchaeota archaeon]